MKESELNTIISRSIDRYSKGWCHKIADPIGGKGIQNPFDGFGGINDKSLYYELKLIKGIYSFNFNEIAPHQWNNLLWFNENIKNSLSLVGIGLYIPRKITYMLWFNISTLYDWFIQDKTSVKKKEIESYINKELYLPIQIEEINGKRIKYVQRIEQIEEVLI
jgi:hypothetical protein